MKNHLTILLLSALAARAATFTTDTTIDFINTSYDGDSITVTNCTVTINGPHTFAAMHILNGGRLTHQGSDSGIFYTGFLTNEQLVLTGTNPAALSQTNVQALSVAVSNASNTISYTNGVDYVLTNIQGVTWIERTTASAIPDGATVSVTYGGAILLGQSGLNLTIVGDLLLDAGGIIDASGLGYNQGFGPGRGTATGNPFSGSGGGYGGYGGLSASNAPGGNAYGLWLQPGQKGSEGGRSSLGPGGTGGGAINLTVGGLLRIDGGITANGATALNEESGGGSGGGIWLSAQTVTGSGSISANGGDGEPPLGGGGGGGRVALYSQTNSFVGTVTARGGRGFQAGGAGTVYIQTGTFASAIADNGSRVGATTPLVTTQAFALTVRSGANVSLPYPQTIGSLLLLSNGWFSISNSALTVLGDAIVQRGSGITGDGLGFPAGSGPGAGRMFTTPYVVGGGGGYGGAGANAGTNILGGGCYGPVHQPAYPGSGGGNGNGTYPYSLGGAGGGSMLLNVNGTLTLDGRISADGGAGIGQASGGGSGGSIWLNVGGFSGSGTISACGGPGNDVGGGGGGGRIALYYQISDFTGILQATGAGTGTNVAGAGTIYTKPAGQPAGQLLLDNGGALASAVSAFTAPEQLAVQIEAGAIATPMTPQSLGSLVLSSNGWLRLTNIAQTVTGDVTINPGCGITADGAGYGSGAGVGAGRRLSYTIPGAGTFYYGGGGGYGGYGGYGGWGSPGQSGGSYGSGNQPVDMGSGGGAGANSGGSGGGAVILTVNGTLLVNGRISADGVAGIGLNDGGGAGGTVSLNVNTFGGLGLISANGGRGNGIGGGGGGGRIAVLYTSSYFTGTMRAYGASGGVFGSAGTVFSKATNQSVSQLLIDNAGVPGLTTVWNTAGTIDLTLRGGSSISNYMSGFPTIRNLLVGSNSWFWFTNTMQPTIVVGGNATIQAGGGIRADGAGAQAGSGQGAGATGGGGAGYGGYGGTPTNSYYTGGNAYGSAISNPLPGSGGGNALGIGGGAGGGALRLEVTGLLVVDGRISADGNPGLPGSNGGGGSGGSVYVTAGALMGTGSFSASGGNGDGNGGGGGGGRIYLLPSANSFVGSAIAYGGNGTRRGGAGTVYISVNQGFGRVIADNGGLAGTNTYISDSGTFDLFVRGSASVSPYNSSVNLRDLTIASNSWIVFNGYPYTSGTITITGNGVIDAGGGITADSAGSPAGSGQGAGVWYYSGTNAFGSGGGYGGYGGKAGPALGGNAYGLALSPSYSGSGGSTSTSYGVGGAGGGSLTVRASGTLTMNGRISANGGAAVSGNAGGGSGGTVNISGGTLLGSGSITANGGAGINLGGGGGGGRIVLAPQVNVFAGTVTAFGGAGANRGGAGTIYTGYQSGFGQILVDNGGYAGTNTFISDSGTFDLTARGGAKAYLATSSATPRNIYIGSNAWLFLPKNASTVNVTGNAVIDVGGTVLADGLGSAGAVGPGAGTVYNGVAGGGAYGGLGGGAVRQVPSGGGSSYGTAQTPNQLGSGGASSTNGGAGGGAILLNVTGTLDVEGGLSANGLPGALNNGGGSGGSIWLTAGTLLGSGSISANGGDGLGLGSGGGGGRIALIYGTNLFTGIATAYGGNGYVGGGAGTIYTASKTAAASTAQVTLDNGGRSGESTRLDSSLTIDVTVKNGAIAAAYSPTADSYVRNILIASNGLFTFSRTGRLYVSGDATVAPGGVMTAAAGVTAGYGAGHGTSATSPSGKAGSGGGYGGNGGDSATGAPGGSGYDSPIAPTGIGSGGGDGVNYNSGGTSGGLAAMTVTGTLQLDGKITANGAAGLAPGGGGGSGGAVSLTVGELAGTGVICANGGSGDGMGGGGGGGRIVLAYNTKTFNGQVTTFGGSGSEFGGAGTVYWLPRNQNSGLFLVDNAGNAGGATPMVITTANVYTPDLTVQDGGIVSFSSAQSWWSNLVVNPGGTVTAKPGLSNVTVSVIRNARVESGGAITFDGLGYDQGNGPGAGLSSNYVGSGGGYGGAGGASSQSVGGSPYGSAQQPGDWGSGGGVGWGVPGPGSEGGGALHLAVGGTLTINGQVTANGNAALQDDAGGGSGGSLWLQASSFNGYGVVSANGGPGQLFDGGGGGGGRTAICSRSSTYAGQLSAVGGLGFYPGQNGSIILSSSFTPPAVISQSPIGLVSNAVGTVDLFFNTPINPWSLANATINLIQPAGAVPPRFMTLVMFDATHVALAIDPWQTSVGDYVLQIGPNILDLFGQPMSQVYTGSFSISLPVIQGTVTDLDGHPVADIVLQAPNWASPVVTDTNGNYSLGVPYSANLTVTPAATNWVLIPAFRAYTNLNSTISNENYLAVSSIVPTISAGSTGTNLALSWFGIPGVSYQPMVSTNLFDWVQYGPALIGTNGPVQLVVPIDSSPRKFFRLRASN